MIVLIHVIANQYNIYVSRIYIHMRTNELYTVNTHFDMPKDYSRYLYIELKDTGIGNSQYGVQRGCNGKWKVKTYNGMVANGISMNDKSNSETDI